MPFSLYSGVEPDRLHLHVAPLGTLEPQTASERRGNNFDQFQGKQGQNLAVALLFVPFLLYSGIEAGRLRIHGLALGMPQPLTAHEQRGDHLKDFQELKIRFSQP